jgi:hypothetical protein
MGIGINTQPYAPGELIELRTALRALSPHIRERDVPRLFGRLIRRRSRTSGFTYRFVLREEFERVKQEIEKSRVS